MPTLSGVVVATGGRAPSRRTLIDVVDELSRPIDAASPVVRAIAADGFRAAVNKMNRKGLWPWEVQDEDITITANQAFATVTSAIKKPLAMHYLDAAGGTRNRKLGYISYDRFVETYNMKITGLAQDYTIPNLFETGQVRFYPIPDSDENARFTYYRVTPAPRTDQQAVEIPEYVIESYMSIAWYEFLKRLPSAQQPYPIAVAMADANQAFREISAHIVSPGDRTRRVGGYGGYR